MTLFNSIARRLEITASIGTDPAKIAFELEMCRRDPVFWIGRWAWTFDPREQVSSLPFDLFPRQAEFIQWLSERDTLQECGLAEKSRDVGFTWLCSAYAVHCWLFNDGDSTGFGSRKLDLVDDRDNPDCIFEKIRYLIRNLPHWMLPRSFNRAKHDKYCTLLNPNRGNTITGEGGAELGRGGRKSRYFVDEAAFLPNPKAVEAALSQTTRVRIDVSTPNGTGNPFYTRRYSGTVPVFTFHWRDDPRKDEDWYEREKRRIGDPVIIAQELDIDYSASIEGVCIPGRWVQAAVNLALKTSGQPVAGWDIADEGRCSNVLICRFGPKVTEIRSWAQMDLLQSASIASSACVEMQAVALNYDCVGIGAGVRGEFNRTERSLSFRPNAINAGQSPGDAIWPDGKTSKERFRNLRAELYWRLRVRFEKTYAHVRHLADPLDPTGAAYPEEELISIPNHTELIQQLALPLYRYTDTGKIQLESKEEMRRRGVPSPDYADALALAFADPPGSWAEALIAIKEIPSKYGVW